MMLSRYDVFPYLLERGLLSPAAVLRGDVVVVPRTARHAGFRVERQTGPGLFLKEARNAAGADFLRREALFYRLVAEDDTFAPLRGVAPGFVAYDAAGGVLALELLENAITLSQLHGATRSAPVEPASRLGEILGRWHRSPPLAPGDDRWRDAFPGARPWILALHRGASPQANAAASYVAEALRQDSEVRRAMEELCGDWRCLGLVHGDLKFDNCLVLGAGDADAGRAELRILDWEIADRGDPAWDVAGVLQCYLLTWIQSTFGRRAYHPACRDFWRAYAAARGLQNGSAARELKRAWKLAGARFFQTAFEYAVGQGPSPWPLISSSLQLGRRILLEGESTLHELTGISP